MIRGEQSEVNYFELSCSNSKNGLGLKLFRCCESRMLLNLILTKILSSFYQTTFVVTLLLNASSVSDNKTTGDQLCEKIKRVT
jgi:hypothetical protein